MSNERVGKSQISQNFTEAPDSNFLLPEPSRGSRDWEWKASDPDRALRPSQRPGGAIRISCDPEQPIYNAVFIFNRVNRWLKTESDPTSSWKCNSQITSLGATVQQISDLGLRSLSRQLGCSLAQPGIYQALQLENLLHTHAQWA